MQREIGWSQEANLLHAIVKKIERINKVLCCSLPTTTTTTAVPVTTTTTTTRIPCNYEGVMTVGYNGGDPYDIYGYLSGEGYGSIDPNNNNIIQVDWQSLFEEIYIVTQDCYDEITLYINNIEYIVLFSRILENGTSVYETFGILSNPFPSEGETCNIKLCYGTPCTTTTTSTEVPIGPP